MTDPVSISPVARLRLGKARPAFDEAVVRARDEEWATRLFDRDVTLWSADPRVGQAIADRLGWLDAPDHFVDQIAALEGFGDAIVEQGYHTVVVAGMGGSSLAPDVLHRTFGSQEGYPDLRILDSTDPAYVAATFDDLDPLRTLVIVASKSGTTTEPNAFLAGIQAGNMQGGFPTGLNHCKAVLGFILQKTRIMGSMVCRSEWQVLKKVIMTGRCKEEL
jgi:hypothetical protein